MAQVKGTLVLHTVKALKRQGAVAQKVIPTPLRPFLEQTILASGWYSEEDHLELLKALIKIQNGHGANLWEEFGRLTAQRDLKGIYKALLKKDRPALTLSRMPTIWSRYHDSGTFTVNPEGDRRAILELRDFPVVSRHLCQNTAGFIVEVLRMSGAEHAEMRKLRCTATQHDHCRWEACWS